MVKESHDPKAIPNSAAARDFASPAGPPTRLRTSAARSRCPTYSRRPWPLRSKAEAGPARAAELAGENQMRFGSERASQLVERLLISVSVARSLIRIPPPASCRSISVLWLHLGVLYHGRPPVELRLQRECELPGRTPHNIPPLLAKLLEDIGFLQRPMQIGEDLGHVLGGHVRRTK